MERRLRYIPTEELQYRQDSAAIVSRRAQRLLAVLQPYRLVGILDQGLVTKLSHEICRHVSNLSVKAALHRDLSVLIGTDLEAENLNSLAYNLAGAVKEIASTGQSGLFATEVKEMDALAKIVALHHIVDQADHTQIRLQLWIQNSVFAGLTLSGYIDGDQSNRWGRSLGLWGNFRKPITWRNYRQLLGAELLVRLSRQSGQVEISGAGVTLAIQKQNRSLAQLRDRKFAKCRYGALHHCVECGIGVNECPLSCNEQPTNLLKGSRDGKASGSDGTDATRKITV